MRVFFLISMFSVYVSANTIIYDCRLVVDQKGEMEGVNTDSYGTYKVQVELDKVFESNELKDIAITTEKFNLKHQCYSKEGTNVACSQAILEKLDLAKPFEFKLVFNRDNSLGWTTLDLPNYGGTNLRLQSIGTCNQSRPKLSRLPNGEIISIPHDTLAIQGAIHLPVRKDGLGPVTHAAYCDLKK